MCAARAPSARRRTGAVRLRLGDARSAEFRREQFRRAAAGSGNQEARTARTREVGALRHCSSVCATIPQGLHAAKLSGPSSSSFLDSSRRAPNMRLNLCRIQTAAYLLVAWRRRWRRGDLQVHRCIPVHYPIAPDRPSTSATFRVFLHSVDNADVRYTGTVCWILAEPCTRGCGASSRPSGQGRQPAGQREHYGCRPARSGVPRIQWRLRQRRFSAASNCSGLTPPR